MYLKWEEIIIIFADLNQKISLHVKSYMSLIRHNPSMTKYAS